MFALLDRFINTKFRSFRLPLNWRTPKGYMIAIAIQSAWLSGGALVVLSTMLPFSGICELFGAFCMDINQNLANLNDKVVNFKQNFTADDRIQIIKRFYAIIEFHSEAKQLSFLFFSGLKIHALIIFPMTIAIFNIRFVARFSAIYSLMLTAFFGISTPSICTALLNLNTVCFQIHSFGR